MTADEIEKRAQRNADISIVFEAAVSRIFGGSHAVEMTRPEGGARSILHIRLVIEEASYTLGWADPIEGTAQLHTLGHTLAHSKKTRGRELVLRPLDYTRFLEVAVRVLEDFGMKVTLLAYTKNDVEAERGARHESGERERCNVHTRTDQGEQGQQARGRRTS